MSEPIIDPAATVDDQPPPVTTDPEQTGAPSQGGIGRTLREGQAKGGPLDGRDVVSRYPKGIVAVDRANDLAWIYDYTPEVPAGDASWQPGQFVVRDEAGLLLDAEKRWTAAEGADYDVVAVG